MAGLFHSQTPGRYTTRTLIDLIESEAIEAGDIIFIAESKETTTGCFNGNVLGKWMFITFENKKRKYSGTYNLMFRDEKGFGTPCTCESLQGAKMCIYVLKTNGKHPEAKPSAEPVNLINSTVKTPTTYMSSILNTVKKLALKKTNPDEAALREAGLHDSDGELTVDGIDVMHTLLEKTVKAEMVAIANEINSRVKPS